MALMVLETEALAETALPVAALASQMRLPEGYGAVPGQAERLGQRLRAAVISMERRLGLVTLAREVVLAGPGGAARLRLPVAPYGSLVSVEAVRGGVSETVAGAAVEEDALGRVLVLPAAPEADARMRVVVRAGFGGWDAVPAPLAQAILLEAEALETGMRPASAVEALVAPWRRRRLGGRG